MRVAVHQAQGQVVLPQVPGGPAQRHEAKVAVPQGAGEVQQGEGGEGVAVVDTRVQWSLDYLIRDLTTLLGFNCYCETVVHDNYCAGQDF